MGKALYRGKDFEVKQANEGQWPPASFLRANRQSTKAKLASLGVSSMGSGGRDINYPPYNPQPPQTSAYSFQQGLNAGISSWPSLPVVYSVPRPQGELIYYAQPLGVPASAVGTYHWNVYACQAPVVAGMDIWPGR